MRTSKKQNRIRQWIKEGNLKIISRVLDAVKLNFSDSIQFIEDCLEQECLKKNISVDVVIFYYIPRSKMLARKNISYSLVLGFKSERFSLHLTKYAKRYTMKLNSLSHDIYLRVRESQQLGFVTLNGNFAVSGWVGLAYDR